MLPSTCSRNVSRPANSPLVTPESADAVVSIAEFGAVRADYRRGEVAYAFIDLRGEVLDRFRAPARP